MHSVQTFPPYFPNIHSIIILSILTSSDWSLPLRFSDPRFERIFHLSHACYVHRPSHPPYLDRPNNI